MPITYRATLTDVGAALVADAIASGTTLTWAKMALGDGNGNAVIVDAGRTSLVNERYRAPLNDLGRDSANPNTIVGTLVVPPETGGWTIREFGIYDNASTPRLVAYGETPEIEKPASAAGTGINLRLRFKVAVSADANITLSPDSNEAYATIEYVKDNAVKSLSVSGRTITYTMGDGDTHTITTQDTTYNDVTRAVHGLMSAEDKIILDAIPTMYAVKDGTLANNPITRTSPAGHTAALQNGQYNEQEIFDIGWSPANRDGALLGLRSSSHPTQSGIFQLIAQNSIKSASLIGSPNGLLTWKNSQVISVADLVAGLNVSINYDSTTQKITIAIDNNVSSAIDKLISNTQGSGIQTSVLNPYSQCYYTVANNNVWIFLYGTLASQLPAWSSNKIFTGLPIPASRNSQNIAGTIVQCDLRDLIMYVTINSNGELILENRDTACPANTVIWGFICYPRGY